MTVEEEERDEVGGRTGSGGGIGVCGDEEGDVFEDFLRDVPEVTAVSSSSRGATADSGAAGG